jgi:signal transduction histidine kinase
MAEKSNMMESVRVLYEIGTLIRSDSELTEKFVQALHKVKDAVRCHSASLFMYNEQNSRLEEAASVGSRVNLIEGIDFDLGMGFSAWVAKQRRSVLIPNLRKERSEGFRCFGSVPLISGEKLIGVMNLGHREPNALTEEHMQFLEIVAGQLANVIERTRFECELIATNAALVKAQDEIRKQQQQLVEMEKYQVIAQVAASINHEINNPLTTIMGNIDLILIASPHLDPAIRKKLTTVLDEARRIAEIIKKIRNIKRIVLEDYLGKTGEKMLDINSSIVPGEESEKLS